MKWAGNLKLTQNCQLFLHFVRGASSQIVVIGHAGSVWGVIPLLEPPHAPYMQNLAVVFFFVVSGLVISYSALNKTVAGYSFAQYFHDRFARIYCGLVPALVFVAASDIAMLFLMGTFGNAEKVDVRNFISSLLLTATHPLPIPGNGTIFGTLRPLWTLIIEWWIYIAFGVVLTCPKSIIPWLFAAFGLPFLVTNLFGGEGHGLALIWVMGSLALWPIIRIKACPNLLLMLAMLLATASVTALPTPPTYSFALNVLLATSLFLAIWASNNADWNLPSASINFFANYSFTLYLVHYTIIIHGVALLRVNAWEGFFLTVFASNLFGWSLSYVGERRYPALRKWLGREK